MRERTEKAHGPYRRGRRWRVVETSATGARSTCSFASEELALEYLADFNDEAEGRTVSGVIDAFRDHQREAELAPGTVITVGHRLHAILRDVERDRLLSSVTPAQAAQLYERRRGEVAVDTHRGELAAAAAMFAWCVRKGWLRANPFADVEPVGQKKTRKDKLRIAEARTFLRVALAEDSDAGLASAMALMMGLRASEVVDRVTRDIDDRGRVLWIDDAKTEAGERHLEVPKQLRARLVKLVAGRDAGARLFGDNDRHWVGRHVRRLCGVAKVPEVSPHGLRRSWSSLAAETEPMERVSRALGHAGTAITRRHYVEAGAEQRRDNSVVLRVLAGGRK